MADSPSKIPYLPDRLQGLASIAMNLSWRWHHDALAMLNQLDPILWSATRHNPVDMLRRMEPSRLAECALDDEFLELYDRVLARLEVQQTSREGTWFAEHYPELTDKSVAYFCAEFGLHNSVPICRELECVTLSPSLAKYDNG